MAGLKQMIPLVVAGDKDAPLKHEVIVKFS